MNISTLDAASYEKAAIPFSLYDSSAFIELNRHKADSVHYLLFCDDKPRFALAGGVRDHVLKLPFSASFCAFSRIGNNRIEHYYDAVSSLIVWAQAQKIRQIVFSLPPLFYDVPHISKMQNALWGNGFEISAFDLNFEYFLAAHGPDYPDRIDRCARKNCRRAEKEGLTFEKTDDFAAVYETIRINRTERGFPLKMSLEDVVATSKVIPTDFFAVKTPGNEIASAAITQRMDSKTVRVVYWGNPGAFEQLRPVNFLAWKLFDYYKKMKFDVVDIGISTVDGVPNNGLCAFKESIGCSCSPKITFERNI